MPRTDHDTARGRSSAGAAGAGDAGRVYGGLTAGERRERRRRALLAAGLAVFAERGLAAATVQDVCREAGLSQRYLYEAFADLDELFGALLDDLAAEVETLLAAAFHGRRDDPEVRIRTALRALARYFAEDPRRARVALVESFASAAFRRRRHRSLAAFARLAAAELRGLRRDAGAAGPDAEDHDLDLTVLVLVGGIAEALMASVDPGPAHPDGRAVADVEVLVEHLTRLFLAAAGTQRPADPSPVPAAVAAGGGGGATPPPTPGAPA